MKYHRITSTITHNHSQREQSKERFTLPLRAPQVYWSWIEQSATAGGGQLHSQILDMENNATSHGFDFLNAAILRVLKLRPCWQA
ncbi:hypothetical protein Pcinc_019298 [Petrolisthes cinctipes]|uniref:Uncharacterized protein n=1 Tax=Petrolisthes cinctipes TaxID=88211 RepID=A0AAE1KKL8_PETCI|nr:hypothetical protein Pcinc_019298 [Petrolisthes cinctipes]